MTGEDGPKRRAAERAVQEVQDGMVLGLGSGSTAAHAIRAIGQGGLEVVGVPTSYQAADVARDAGVPVRTLADVEGVDLAIDGADQIAGMDVIKGGGGAHAREKVIDTAADRFVVVADETKVTDQLDDPVPVEILPETKPVVADAVRALGGQPSLRAATAKSGPVVTDNGNLLLDCAFGPLEDPGALATELAGTPGVVDHGLFVELADRIYVGSTAGVETYDG